MCVCVCVCLSFVSVDPMSFVSSVFARGAEVLSQAGCTIQTAVLLALALGVVLLTLKALCLFGWCFRSFVRPPTNLKKYTKDGKWTVITGASDGIGKGFAQELAKKGANLLLISRTASKLESLKEELSGSDAKIETLAVDVSKPVNEVFPAIEQALAGKQVSMLINNVGINTTEIPEKFMDQDFEKAEQMVQVNITFMLRLTHHLLKLMKRNHEGVVINLASFAGDFPTPLMSVYSATKAFIDTWTRAMSAENKEDGVVFLSAKPYLTESNMSRTRASLMVPTARRMAHAILARVGTTTSVSPYWAHNIFEFVVRCMPERMRLVKFRAAMLKTAAALKRRMQRQAKEAEDKKEK